MKMNFENLDFEKSPYTGLTRKHWIDAGLYMLRGILQDVHSMDDPIIVRRHETEITYPQKDAEGKLLDNQQKSERFEGLARSFLIASPIIHNNPSVEIEGKSLREYYKKQILSACTRENPLYVGDFNYLVETGVNGHPFPRFQQTVESAALVIGLWASKTEIWDSYTKEEQDIIADFIKSFAYGNTNHSNWQLFCILDLAFLDMVGYEIDHDLMLKHIGDVMHFYVGEGWYRDGVTYDYYSLWAFNLYLPLWNVWYGYKHLPEIAEKFENNSNELLLSYYNMFDKEGFTTMWGRSSIYRNGATASFFANGMLKNSKLDGGFARRIMSGSLKQFLERDDFLCEGVPSLGYYGTFSPLLQSYSCSASPLWCSKAFLALCLPEEHPLWSAVETNGFWEDIKKDEIIETVLNVPGICLTNHGDNGETTFRTGKTSDKAHGVTNLNNYGKLSYNSQFPWEAELSDNPEVQSQQYIICDKTTEIPQRANVTFWGGMKNGVLYRRQYFEYFTGGVAQCMQAIYPADFPVPSGLIRADRLDLYAWPATITLGSYGIPDNGCEIKKTEKDGAKAIVIKGKDHRGDMKQIAMTIYDGWDEIDIAKSEGTNPDGGASVVIYAKTTREKTYDAHAKHILISQTITRVNGEDFTEDEIFPIKNIEYTDRLNSGLYGDTTITLKTGKAYKVNFEGVDGRVTL